MSIKWKLVVMYIALVFIVMISAGTFIIFSLQIDERRNVENVLDDTARTINVNVFGSVYTGEAIEDVPPVEGIAIEEGEGETQLGKNLELVRGTIRTGIEAFIIRSSDGKTIESTVDNAPDEYNYFTQSVVISALAGDRKFSYTRQYVNAEDIKVTYFEYAIPVPEPKDSNPASKVDYVIYVRKNATDFNASLAQTTQIIALSVLLALVATSVIGVLFANSLTSHILMLTKKTKEFAMGNLKEEIVVASKDEIGQLTESFNNMARDLDETISEMASETNKMEIVMYNMTDGVLAYDNNGVLIHSNHICEELLNFSCIESMSLREMLVKLGFELPEDEALNIELLKDSTIAISDKYINTSFNPYKNKEGHVEGIIIVLQDITKHMKLDNMRKEFVANVSHEIRTPLTTIKSYTETLLDGALEDKETATEFLQTINNEADRMTLIVKDLLELSRLDNHRMDLNFKMADLVDLVSNNVRQHKITAEKQNKTISFSTEIDKIEVKMDSERINQVVNNIVTNALRYSYEKAEINVHINESYSSYRVYVSDNGMGIPKEDLRRVFERFYRVDKARSRALGGTGLGLSIAKEIMVAHGGRISASSELGKGTTMVLRFPKEFDETAYQPEFGEDITE